MINYLIIDDEYLAHEVIKDYCDMLPNMELKKNCYDALEAFEYLSEHNVDLIFLDLNMPKLKGFEFLRTLPNPPKVIVSTAYAEYALEGYELNISDYLLKPFSFERFLKAVNKAVGSSKRVTAIPSEKLTEIPKTIFLRENKKYTQVEIDSILFLEASGNYTKVITKNDTLTIREKISELINSFQAEDFIQIHKSFAVAVKHIKSIEGNRIFIEDHEIPIGKKYKANLAAILG
tara:strand:+ start:26188 stop:26886 length:699 start_codon:yes stop_codon:yes gene_type:complete